MLKQTKKKHKPKHYRHILKLQLSQVNKISDKSFLQHRRASESIDNELIECFIDAVKYRLPVLKSTNKWLLLWNFIMLCAIFYYFLEGLFTIFIIARLQHENKTVSEFNLGLDCIIMIVFLFDLVAVRWRVQCLTRSGLIKQLSLLLKAYIGQYFFIDLLSIIILILEISYGKLGFWKLLIYLKVFMFVKIKTQLNLSLKGYGNLELAYKAVRLLMFVTFWSFLFSCVFVAIELNYIFQGGFYKQNGLLWLTSSPSLKFTNLYEHFDWYVWFQYALFFVLQMVRGAGMGVPSPRCPLSILWYNISNVTMTVLFWYFTDKVILVVQKHLQKKELIEKLGNLKAIKKVIHKKFDDYKKYKKYLIVSIDPDIEATYHQHKISSMITGQTFKELQYGMKQYFSLRFTFLKAISSDTISEQAFKKKLANIITSKVYYPNQVICQRNKVSQGRLYLSQLSQFIVSNLEIEYAERLEEWSFTGIRQFFIDRKSIFDVIASKITTVNYISNEQFTSILKSFPRIYDSYCQRMDLILIQRKSTETIELQCWHCQEYHLSEDCPKIAFDKQAFLERLLFKTETTLKQGQPISFNFRKRHQRSKEVQKKLKYLKKQKIEADKYYPRTFSFVDYNIDQIAEIIEMMSSQPSAITSAESQYPEVGQTMSAFPATP